MNRDDFLKTIAAGASGAVASLAITKTVEAAPSKPALSELTDFDLIQELVKRSKMISISCQVEQIECPDENGWRVVKAGEMKTFNLCFTDKRSGLVEMKFNTDKVKDIEWIPSHLKFWNS